jgi:hypothetical protein
LINRILEHRLFRSVYRRPPAARPPSTHVSIPGASGGGLGVVLSYPSLDSPGGSPGGMLLLDFAGCPPIEDMLTMFFLPLLLLLCSLAWGPISIWWSTHLRKNPRGACEKFAREATRMIRNIQTSQIFYARFMLQFMPAKLLRRMGLTARDFARAKCLIWHVARKRLVEVVEVGRHLKNIV